MGQVYRPSSVRMMQMDSPLPAWLRCINKLNNGICLGTLTSDEGQLHCTQCGHHYPHHHNIPCLLSPPSPLDQYSDDQIIRTYYEAQFGPFIQPSAALNQRLQLPHSAPDRGDADPFPYPAEAEESAAMDAVETLMTAHNLTEPFYRTILAMCRPYVKPGMQILDVGCGLGRMTAELAMLTDSVVLGIDRSERMVCEATRIIKTPGPHTIDLNAGGGTSIPAELQLDWECANTSFMMADALALPVASSAIDFVVCLNLLDRVPRPKQLIAELYRVLRPDGLLVIADPYHWDENFTPKDEWVTDMRVLFPTSHWTIKREVVSMPFVIRDEPRQLTTYQNHCLIYQKSGSSVSTNH